MSSIGGSIGVLQGDGELFARNGKLGRVETHGGLCKSDLLLAGVVHSVESLTIRPNSLSASEYQVNVHGSYAQPSESHNEIQTTSRVTPNIRDNQVDLIALSVNGAVQRTRPDLGVSVKGEHLPTNLEIQVLEFTVLCGGDGEETGVVVKGGTGCVFVSAVCVASDESQSGACHIHRKSIMCSRQKVGDIHQYQRYPQCSSKSASHCSAHSAQSPNNWPPG